MQSEWDVTTELAPINPIRVETALSRFPIHRLSKHGDVTINIREQNDDGETLIQWEISHNSKYGQPGPLAYKLDTLIINRRIEEATRPIPKIIRLGSLREIAEELGFSTHDSNKLKNALYQNAFAAITAKTRYRQINGKERTAEIGDTRYGVVFTGEKLPDGRAADAVYIVLHDFYREILDNAITRPLDYDYLRDLTPAPQRFYELLSYHIYAALKYERPRAKLIYSEFCTYAPQTRYLEFEKVKKQMHKIHSVHKKSGYIDQVNFHQTTDAAGQPDWIMLYKPGQKASAEFQAFTKRVGFSIPYSEQGEPGQDISQPKQLDLKLTPPRKSRRKAQSSPTPSPMASELAQRGVTADRAAELVELYPERIMPQIEILDWLIQKEPRKIDDPAAYLVKAIERNNAPPKGFVSAGQRQKDEEDRQARQKQEAVAQREQRQVQAREQAKTKRDEAYWESLTPEQKTELQAKADAATDPDQLKDTGTLNRSLKSLGQHIRRKEYIRRLLDSQE